MTWRTRSGATVEADWKGRDKGPWVTFEARHTIGRPEQDEVVVPIKRRKS